MLRARFVVRVWASFRAKAMVRVRVRVRRRLKVRVRVGGWVGGSVRVATPDSVHSTCIEPARVRVSVGVRPGPSHGMRYGDARVK